jgi:hypothetical protein
MLSCNLFGGLGNYLFQVATTHSLSIDNNDFCVFNDKNSYTVHKHFNTYTSNIFRNLKISEENFTLLYNEPFFQFKKIPYQKNLKLSGYFQSEKYFNHNRNSILDLFSIDDDSKNYIKNKYDNILNKKENYRGKIRDILEIPEKVYDLYLELIEDEGDDYEVEEIDDKSVFLDYLPTLIAILKNYIRKLIDS